MGRRAHHPRRTMRSAAIVAALMCAGVVMMAMTARGNSILGSRHDLSFFNMRGYGTETGPMTGATFNDYREACIYCHTPHNGSTIAPMWNRQMPAGGPGGGGNGPAEYQVYTSVHLDSKAQPNALSNGPDGISLACLSCHDGTVAIDAVVNKPKFHDWSDSGTHYRLDAEGSIGSDTCGKCHNRTSGAYGGIGGAHDATIRYLTRDLRDDHPISMPFPTYAQDPGFNQPMLVKSDGGREFPNGVQTFEGDKVQCASCHDPHNPDESNTEGRDPFLRGSNRNSALCLTCHQK
jgi:hypothetical protein